MDIPAAKGKNHGRNKTHCRRRGYLANLRAVREGGDSLAPASLGGPPRETNTAVEYNCIMLTTNSTFGYWGRDGLAVRAGFLRLRSEKRSGEAEKVSGTKNRAREPKRTLHNEGGSGSITAGSRGVVDSPGRTLKEKGLSKIRKGPSASWPKIWKESQRKAGEN